MSDEWREEAKNQPPMGRRSAPWNIPWASHMFVLQIKMQKMLTTLTIHPRSLPTPTAPEEPPSTSQWPHHHTNCQSYRFGIQLVSSFCSSGELLQHALVQHEYDRNRVPSTAVLKHARGDVPLQLIKERLVVRCMPESGVLHSALQNGDVIVTLNGVGEPTFGMLYGRMCRREVLCLTVLREGEDAKIGKRKGTEEVPKKTRSRTGSVAKEKESSAMTMTQSNTTGAKDKSNDACSSSTAAAAAKSKSTKATTKSKKTKATPSPTSNPPTKLPYPTLSTNETKYASTSVPFLPRGWTQRTISHNSSGIPKKRADVMFYSPKLQIKFRSKKRALEFVALCDETRDEELAWELLNDDGVDKYGTLIGALGGSVEEVDASAERPGSGKAVSQTLAAQSSVSCSVPISASTSQVEPPPAAAAATQSSHIDLTGYSPKLQSRFVNMNASEPSFTEMHTQKENKSNTTNQRKESDCNHATMYVEKRKMTGNSSESRDFTQLNEHMQDIVDFGDGNDDDNDDDNASVKSFLSSSSSSSSSSSGSSSSSSSSSSESSVESLEEASRKLDMGAAGNATRVVAEMRKRPLSVTSAPTAPNRNAASVPQNQPSNELNRLWPDPSDAIKALTRWMPPSAVVKLKPGRNDQCVQFVGPIQNKAREEKTVDNINPMLQPSECSTRNGSKTFVNAEDLLCAFAYPLMNEGLCSLNNDYHSEKHRDGRWDRQTYNLRVTKLTEVSPIFRSKSYFKEPVTMYEFQFALNGLGKTPPNSLSELYAIHFGQWSTTKFGIVAHDFPTSVSFMRTRRENTATLKLWVCVAEDEFHARDTGWITRREFRLLLHPYRTSNPLQVRENVNMTLISVGSTINIVRQFEAIKSIPHLKPHLQKAIFTSHAASTRPSISEPNAKRPSSVPLDIWQSLKKTNNPYQLQSISDLLSGACRENFSLIQGPPGTGKSSTVVGLVSALLSGKAPIPGGKRSTSCVIHPGKTIGTSMEEATVKNRILVCATTNQAVDSLAWKIKNQSLGTSGKVGDFKMARFGSLPWDTGARENKNTKPKVMSEMEKFLYDINVDVKASSGYEYADEDSGGEWDELLWTPPEGMHKKKKRKRFRGGARQRSELLSSCNIVLTTLSGAGSKAFIDAVCRSENNFNSEFRAVIIDEACQSSEPETLIPFKFNPTTVTLVGDPQQLPVLRLSGSSICSIYERSLFERLQNLSWPTILLREQYRMHESIASFPSREFYGGQLVTSDDVKKRPFPLWQSNPCFETLAFWDSNGSKLSKKGNGYANKDEVDFIIRVLLSTFVKEHLVRSDISLTVGIISFYKDQVKMLQDGVASVPVLRNNSRLNVKVATVDGFQGSECDIIILSCVRSHAEAEGKNNKPSVGFIKDYRRCNVALTRAKHSLWIIGNAQVLKSSSLWGRLVEHLEQYHHVRPMGDFRKIHADWKASQER